MRSKEQSNIHGVHDLEYFALQSATPGASPLWVPGLGYTLWVHPQGTTFMGPIGVAATPLCSPSFLCACTCLCTLVYIVVHAHYLELG